MIGEDTGRDDDPRSRCSLIGSDVGSTYLIMYIQRLDITSCQ